MQHHVDIRDGGELSASGERQWPAPVTAQFGSVGLSGAERRGWWTVAGLATVMCLILGATISSIGVFFVPVSAAFQCDDSEVARSATFFIGAMTLAMPVAGWLLDRVSARMVMVIGSIIAAAGYVAAAASGTIWMFSLALALSGAGVGASTYVPSIVIVSTWITERRALAFGVLLAGASIGAASFPLATNSLIEAIGWRGALQYLAAAILVMATPILLAVARPNPTPSSEQPGPAAASSRGNSVSEKGRVWSFALLTLSGALASLGVMGTYFYIVPYLISAGYSGESAARLYAAVGVASFFGYLVLGALAERTSAKLSLIVGLFTSSAGAILLLGADSLAFGTLAAGAFVIFWGATFNAVNQLLPVLLVETMGSRSLGSLVGINQLVAGLAGAVGPVAAGLMHNSTGRYAGAFSACALLLSLSAVPILLIRDRRRRPLEAPTRG